MEGGWEVIPGVRFGGCGDGDGAALELCLRLEVPRRNPSRCQPRLRRARRRGGGGGGGGRKSPVRLQLPPQALPRCSVPAPGPPPALPAARTPAAARAEPLPRGEPRATVAPHRGRESPFGAGRRRTKRLRGGGGENRTEPPPPPRSAERRRRPVPGQEPRGAPIPPRRRDGAERRGRGAAPYRRAPLFSPPTTREEQPRRRAPTALLSCGAAEPRPECRTSRAPRNSSCIPFCVPLKPFVILFMYLPGLLLHLFKAILHPLCAFP